MAPKILSTKAKLKQRTEGENQAKDPRKTKSAVQRLQGEVEIVHLRVSSEERRTKSVSITVAVASDQADLRPRGSRERTPWRIGGQGSGEGHVRWTRFPLHAVGKAPVLGRANWDGPGGRQLASFERGEELHGEGARRWLRALWREEGEVVFRFVLDLSLREERTADL